MKIIVDEMPKSPADCIYTNGMINNYDEGLLCFLREHRKCKNTRNCPYLKPITDFNIKRTCKNQRSINHGSN